MQGPSSHRAPWRFHLSLLAPSLLTLVLVAVLAIHAVNVLAGVRGYVGGESLWSKARGKSVHLLLHYAKTKDAADLMAHRQALKGIDDVRLARETLNRDPDNVPEIGKHLIAAGHHPDDINNMVTLFRRLGDRWLFKDALDAWLEGDRLIGLLKGHATELEAAVTSGAPPQAIEAITADIELLNLQLRAAEIRFGQSLGHASRVTENVLIASVVVVAMVLSVASILLARRTLTAQARHEAALAANNRRWELAQAKAAMEHEATERVNQAQRAFLARLSHELRTPLNAVIGFAQLLLSDPRKPLTDMQHRQTDMILSAGEHLLGLVEDVFDISKVESGEITMDIQDVDVCQVLRASTSLIDGVRAASKITVVDMLPHARMGAWADPHRLQQVFINLLTNACKYNRVGGQVILQARVTPTQVLVDIMDDGIGLSADDIAQLFQPFKRIAPNPAIEGTGLGLYIVRQLIERMQGHVSVESEPGQGSRFTIELLRANTPAQTT